MLPGGSRMMCMIWDMFPGLDLYYADPAQSLTTVGEEIDYLDHELSHLFELWITTSETSCHFTWPQKQLEAALISAMTEIRVVRPKTFPPYVSYVGF